MTDNWNFYFCTLSGRRASIFVDLGLGETAPFPAYGHVGVFRLYMIEAREDGFSSSEEFERLIAVEDALSTALADEKRTLYVGRITTDGERDFFCYTSAPDALRGIIVEVMKGFPQYRFDVSVRPDPEWKTYFELLHPAPVEWEQIRNNAIRRQLMDQGDTLTEPREIDHWAYFEDEDARDLFIERAGELGYALRQAVDPEGERQNYSAQVWRRSAPRSPEFDEETLALRTLAEEMEGEYDGCEIAVIRPEE